jgi:hypothetical protein
MPSAKGRASNILNQYGAAQSELIGKTVALDDGMAGTVENVSLDELHGLQISIKGMTEDGQSQPSSSGRTRPSQRAQSARFFSDHSNQNEKSDLDQESDAHGGDR